MTKKQDSTTQSAEQTRIHVRVVERNAIQPPRSGPTHARQQPQRVEPPTPNNSADTTPNLEIQDNDTANSTTPNELSHSPTPLEPPTQPSQQTSAPNSQRTWRSIFSSARLTIKNTPQTIRTAITQAPARLRAFPATLRSFLRTLPATLKAWYRQHFFPALGGFLLTIAILPFFALSVQAANADLVPDSDVTTGWPTTTGTSHYTEIDDGSTPDMASYIATDTANSSYTDEFTMSTASNIDEATSITIRVFATSVTANPSSVEIDTLSLNARINGTLQTASTIYPIGSYAWFSISYTGSWTQADIDSLQVQLTRNVVGGGNPSNRADEIRVASVYVDLTYTPAVDLEQSSYRWFDNEPSHTVVVDSNPFAVPAYSLGDTGPAGGLIFHIDDGTYYESAPTSTGTAPWGCSGTLIGGANGVNIGTGRQNTQDILAGCATAGIAARESDNYTLNSFNDWFLPSKAELNKMYVNLHLQGLGSFDVALPHFSSSQVTATTAWFQFFGSGNQASNTTRDNSANYRPVRSFTLESQQEFSFDMPTASSVGAFRFEYCENNPIADGGTCTPPAGLDVSGFTIDSQGGATGFSKDATNTSTNEIVINKNPAQAFAVDETVGFTFDDITKTNDPFFVRVHTYDSDDITTATVIDDQIMYSSEALVGSPLATQDTPVTAPAEDTPFRLRASMSTDLGDLPVGEGNYKLQYAELGPGAVCTLDFSGGEVYSDVNPQSVSPSDWDTISNSNINIPGDTASLLFTNDENTLVVGHSPVTNSVVFVNSSDPDPANWTNISNGNITIPGTVLGSTFNSDDSVLVLMHGNSGGFVRFVDSSSSDPGQWDNITNGISLPGVGWGARFSNDDNVLVLLHAGGNNITFVDSSDPNPANWSTITNNNIVFSSDGLDAVFSSDGDTLVLVHGGGDAITFVDSSDPNPANWSEITNNNVSLPNTSYKAIFNNDESLLIAAHRNNDKVTIIDSSDPDPSQWSIINNDNVYATGDAYDVAFNSDETILAIGHSFGDGITLVDSSDPDPTKWKLIPNSNIAVDNELIAAVAFAKNDNVLVFGHADGGNISFIDSTSVNTDPVAFYDNPDMTDGQGVAATADDPNPGSGTAVLQDYVESNPFTNSSIIPNGDYGIWDFSLVDNRAPGEAKFCFRTVDDTGGELSTYSVMPELNIEPPTLVQDDYRWFENGPSDVEFGTAGVIQSNFTANHDAAYDIAKDDQHMYVIGYEGVNGIDWRIEKRRLTDGALCTAAACGTEFGTGGGVTSNATANNDRPHRVLVDENYIYVAGYQTTSISPSTDSEWRVEKRDKITGELVTGFGASGFVTSNPGPADDEARSMAMDDQYLYIGGFYNASGDDQWRTEKRDKTTGDLVTGFGTNGVIQDNHSSGEDIMWAVAVDGSDLYLGGYDEADGALDAVIRVEKRDTTTGDLITGYANNGVYRNNFTPSGTDSLMYNTLVVDGDYVYFAGQAGDVATSSWHIMKQNKTNGALCDNTTDCPEGVFDSDGILLVDIASGGGTVTGLSFDGSYMYMVGTNTDTSNWQIEKRLKSDATPDTAFGSNGVVTYSQSATQEDPRGMVIDNTHMWVVGYDYAPGNYQWNIQKRKLTSGNLVDSANAEGATVGATLATQNQPASIDENQNARLRALVNVSVKDLGVSDFKIQYAPRIGDSCSTDFSGYAYLDIAPASDFISFYDSQLIATGESFKPSANDPDGGLVLSRQSYVESNNFSTLSLVPRESSAMWDFSLTEDASLGGNYCFRIVKSDGSLLDGYQYIPEISTPPRPQQFLRHGRWFDTGEQGRPFYW